MSGKMKFIILLVVLWVAIFVGSYFMSVGIEGPRNIDTGFKRLDVLVRFQLMAFVVAVVAAVSGIVWRRDAKRIMLVGIMPLLVTLLLVAGLFITALIFANRPAPETTYPPPKPTAPVVDQPIQD